MNADEVLQRSTDLVGILLVSQSQQAVSGSTNHDITVLTFPQTGDVGWEHMPLQVVYLDVLELVVVV